MEQTQQPLRAKEGKEEFEEFFTKLIDDLKFNDFVATLPSGTHGESLLGHTWAYGVMPNSTSAGMTPQGLPMFKMLIMGEIEFFVFKAMDVVKAMETQDASNVTIKDGKVYTSVSAIKNFLYNFDQEQLQICKDHGILTGKHFRQTPETIIYIPAGYFLIERASSNVLIYGVRKSVAPKTLQSVAMFSAAIDILTCDGRDSSKYLDLLKVLEKAADPSIWICCKCWRKRQQ